MHGRHYALYLGVPVETVPQEFHAPRDVAYAGLCLIDFQEHAPSINLVRLFIVLSAALLL